jgi:hypothetical protein
MTHRNIRSLVAAVLRALAGAGDARWLPYIGVATSFTPPHSPGTLNSPRTPPEPRDVIG